MKLLAEWSQEWKQFTGAEVAILIAAQASKKGHKIIELSSGKWKEQRVMTIVMEDFKQAEEQKMSSMILQVQELATRSVS